MASVGGLVNGLTNGTGPASILNSIKDSLFSSQTLGGLVSVGASVGLDAIGAPPILQSFVPGILSQLVAGATGSTGGGGGPGPDGVTNDGKSFFGKIVDNFSKFGGGLVSAAGSLVSFGQKVLEGVGSITKQGFGKAVDFFANVFSRQTIEKLISIGGGSIQSAIEQFSNITANGVEFIKDGISIIWNATTDAYSYVDGAIRGAFDKLSVDSIGKFSTGAIDIGHELVDGIFLDQTVEGSNQNIHLKDGQGNSLFRIIGQAGKAIFDAAGGILNGAVEGINGFVNIVIEGGKVVASNIAKGAAVAWDALSNLAKTIGGGFQKAVEFVDQALFKIFVGSRDHDKWGQADIESNLNVKLDPNHPDVYAVSDIIEKPEVLNAVRARLSDNPEKLREFDASLFEIRRVVNAHPEGAPLYVYIGDATGVNNHIVNRELGNSASFVRDIFTFNGDHLPTEIDGVKIYLNDSSGNVLKNSLGQEIHNVRVGDGWHFHNISNAFAFFHHDASAPNTSFGGMILHGLEFTSSIASGVAKTVNDILNDSGDQQP